MIIQININIDINDNNIYFSLLMNFVGLCSGKIKYIIVKPIIDNQFQIIAGERRWRACQLNGMHEVDCISYNLIL